MILQNNCSEDSQSKAEKDSKTSGSELGWSKPSCHEFERLPGVLQQKLADQIYKEIRGITLIQAVFPGG